MLLDPHCTPGATNRAVTQATLESTICKAGWSESRRPPESVTEGQKRLSLAAYGYSDGRSLHTYEFDHLIPLELDGASDSPENLWPEPDYPGVSDSSYYLNPKDHVEDELHDWVCRGRITLGAAQHVIATNWIDWYRTHIVPITTAPSPKPGKIISPSPTQTETGTTPAGTKPPADSSGADVDVKVVVLAVVGADHGTSGRRGRGRNRRGGSHPGGRSGRGRPGR